MVDVYFALSRTRYAQPSSGSRHRSAKHFRRRAKTCHVPLFVRSSERNPQKTFLSCFQNYRSWYTRHKRTHSRFIPPRVNKFLFCYTPILRLKNHPSPARQSENRKILSAFPNRRGIIHTQPYTTQTPIRCMSAHQQIHFRARPQSMRRRIID